ncbi:MAG: GntR family transcriptional regulator [Syntrophobacter sp.]
MSPYTGSHTSGLTGHPRSIADQIYELLKRDIIKGKIEPGHRLSEVEVANTFNASRTPVREAFRRLEQDGLAERLAQGGVRVIQLDEQTIKDLFDLRVTLEVQAIKLACERITSDEISLLKQVRVQAFELLKSTDIGNDFTLNLLFELNSEFHDIIYSSTRSKYLVKVLVNIRAVVLSLRSISIRLDSIREVWEEHSAIIDQLERRDVKHAVRLMSKHIARSAGQVLSFVRSQPLTDPGSTEQPSNREAGSREKDRR